MPTRRTMKRGSGKRRRRGGNPFSTATSSPTPFAAPSAADDEDTGAIGTMQQHASNAGAAIQQHAENAGAAIKGFFGMSGGNCGCNATLAGGAKKRRGTKKRRGSKKRRTTKRVRFHHPKKGQRSRTMKGRKDFTTKKRSKYFNRRGHRQSRSSRGIKRRPFHRR